ncbi:hypothetical protein D3C75_579400 [compost metagenome]
MVSAIIYIVLSVFDALAVMALALKMYRLPFFEYRHRLVFMAIIISVSSYIVRIILKVPEIDLPIQIIMFIIFFRYGMQIKVFFGALIVSASLNAYIILQLVVLYAFISTGAVTYNVVFQSDQAQIQLIQLTSIALAYIGAGCLKMFNGGFSFIKVPPHEFSYREAFIGTNRALLIVVSGALVIVSLALVVTLNYKSYLLIPSSIIVFGLSYYFSLKKEKYNDRKNGRVYVPKH